MIESDSTPFALKARGLYHIYRGIEFETVALRGANLTIAAGEWVSVVGPSGSGKSTLLNVVSGLLEPSGGEVIIDGRDITRLDESELCELRRSLLGIVLQRDNLHPGLTVFENVALPLGLAGTPSRAARSRVEQLLARVGIADRAAHRSYELSGGEAQRAAIAVALAPGPRLLIADEPTGELDAVTTAKILQVLADETSQSGTAMLMVTHNSEVARAADRRLTMRDGVLADAD